MLCNDINRNVGEQGGFENFAAGVNNINIGSNHLLCQIIIGVSYRRGGNSKEIFTDEGSTTEDFHLLSKSLGNHMIHPVIDSHENGIIVDCAIDFTFKYY